MHYYADQRSARDEMEADAAERQMGSCSPLGRMISRLIIKCNGRKGRTRSERMDYGAMAYPPVQTCYVRPATRTVTFNTANAQAMPPQTHALVNGAAPTLAGGGKPRKKKRKKPKSKQVRFTQEGDPVHADDPPPHVAHTHQYPTSVHSQQPQYQPRPLAAAAAEPYYPAAAVHGHGYSRYAPSPLARWEMLGAAGTPRRREYFSGEYRWCYPTPVRDGIYRFATDANRLTTIFSEENPNACAII